MKIFLWTLIQRPLSLLPPLSLHKPPPFAITIPLLTSLFSLCNPTPTRYSLASKLMWSLLKEFARFLHQEKKWWLWPLVLLLLLIGALVVFTASGGIAWLLYPFM